MSSMPCTMPRRDDRSPITLPVNSSGVSTSTDIIGSSSAGRARRMPSLNAIEPAMRKAFSFESTSWYEPNTSVALMSTTG
ncbi:hypothetical protein D9M70_448550 [compost metagenome]